MSPARPEKKKRTKTSSVLRCVGRAAIGSVLPGTEVCDVDDIAALLVDEHGEVRLARAHGHETQRLLWRAALRDDAVDLGTGLRIQAAELRDRRRVRFHL